MPTEWDKLRSWNGSQPNAFEELICQLASYEPVPADSKFDSKGEPDAGVECYWRFPSTAEHGWQAKFFTSPLSASQWQQVDRSVRTALEKHPYLRQYTICMPFDHPDARLEGATSSRDQWNAHVTKWEGWATEKNMCVQFSYWGTHEIIKRLSRDEHRGRHYFWFHKELFTPTWFRQRLNEVIAAVGPRYTPELNVELPISEVFEGLSRSPAFFERFQEAYGEIGKAWSKGFLHEIENHAPEQMKSLYQQLDQVLKTAKRYDHSGMDSIDWSEMECHAETALKCILDINHVLAKIDLQSDLGETKETTGELPKRERLNYAQYHLRGIKEKLESFREFIKSDIAHLANQAAMLLVGHAGTGKTDLFADAANNHIESGSPAVVLLGIEFTKDEPWSQILRLLHLDCTRDKFLGALESAAQCSGRRAIIFIDALNEVEDPTKWQTWLPSMLKCLERYPWIAIAVSMRSSYEELIFPDGLVPDTVVRRVHNGFAGQEYQAAKVFFEFYNVQLPSVPVLNPEFQNPLFLRCLCQGLHNRRLSTIPKGIQGISRVFEFFLDSINKKLAQPGFLDYDSTSRLVHKATSQLAAWLSQQGLYALPRFKARAICDDIHPNTGYDNSLFRHLMSEGVLVKTGRHHDSEGHQEMVAFSYQRLADHLIMQELLRKHVNPENPAEAFANEPMYCYFEDETACRYNQGLTEALAIQGPEILGKEIFELLPELQDATPVCQAFIESLLWRDPRAISGTCLPYINEFVVPDENLHWKFLDAILTIASNPEHAFNADFLHRHLMKFEMAKRDAWWSIFLHNEYSDGENGAVDRLIDWAGFENNKDHISDNSVRLAGIALVWFLTTSNRFLRDRATKALVSLFVNRIDVLCQVIPTFANVNDLYVSERLYAVAYGCALRSNDSNAKLSLAQLVYNVVFKDGSPPCHILLRDYARGVVEVALREGLDLKDIEVHKIKPPYKSDWPLEIPSEDEPQWRPYGIYASVVDHGDFARYILGSNCSALQWSNRRLAGEYIPSRNEQYDAVLPEDKGEPAISVSIAQRWILKRLHDLGWTENRFDEFDSNVNRYSDAGRGTAKPERIGKKYQWIAYHEFLAHLSDNLEFKEDPWSEEPSVYDGPWQLSLRDIDPSSLLHSTLRSKWEPNVSSWWAPVKFDAWRDEPDDTVWRKRLDLIPRIASLPIVTDPKTDREWFVLECTYDWEEPTPPEKDRFNLRRRHIWYMLKSYLVKSDDEESFCNWAKNQHFMGRWMPESHPQTNIFLGEFFWAPAFEYSNTPYHGHQGWTRTAQRSLPCEVLVTADEYLQERGYDCSIEDAISVCLPTKWIVDKMNLSWRGEDGSYFDSAGDLVAQDPSIKAVGPGAILTDKNLMLEFLNSEGYGLVWTLLGEKSIRGSWKKGDSCPGRMELSGYMRMKDGQLSGKATAFWCLQEPEREKIGSIDIP